MYAMCFYGLLILCMTLVSHARQIVNNDGWVPLTEEEVYGRSRIIPNPYNIHKFNKHNQKADGNMFEGNKAKMPSDSSFKEEMDSQEQEIRSKAIKLVKPQIRLRFGQENAFKPTEPETIRALNELQHDVEECKGSGCQNTKIGVSISNNSDNVNEKVVQEDLADVKTRKAKAIPEDNLHNSVNKRRFIIDNGSSGEIDEFQNSFKKGKKENDDLNLYKVTEDSTEVLEDDASENKKRSGYFYPPPTSSLNYLTQNNITDKFLDILSRHNIKPEDELPNYTISRKNKIQGPTNAFMFIPIPLRVLPQFNNLKQLSVDPLLAVLMSNYGYYFPGSYGIHSRYRNLYGHLASNNIHNNKPFGSYKIFSDTDSSN